MCRWMAINNSYPWRFLKWRASFPKSDLVKLRAYICAVNVFVKAVLREIASIYV
jgi:hypothetical protein